MDATRQAGRGQRVRWAARARGLLLVAIAGLYAISIPWYREGGSEPGRWLGLPDWVAVAAACYAGVAVLNALAWLLTRVEDGDTGERSAAAHGSGGKET